MNGDTLAEFFGDVIHREDLQRGWYRGACCSDHRGLVSGRSR